MADGTWRLAEAKAKLSEVVEKARTHGPQHVTRNGKDAAVVVSAEEWAKRIAHEKPNSFIEMLTSPKARILTDEEVDTLFARDRDPGRPVNL